MLIINFFISLIAILVIFGIISSVTKLFLYTFTKYDYKSYYLFLPTFLILGAWSLTFILWYITITYFLNIDIIQVIISIIIKESIITNSFLLTTLIFIFIGLLFQSIALLSINIDYKKLTGNTRFLFKKMLKCKIGKDKNLVIKDDPEKIGFFTSLSISILTFVLITLSFFLLFFIGYLISKKATLGLTL